MTPEVALQVARAAVAELADSRASRPPRALIGRDTRRSGPLLECALAAGAMSLGAEVLQLGVVPTPAVAHLCGELQADVGFVVSASHNPAIDNGIKIFRGDGRKLSDAREAAIEARCSDDAFDSSSLPGGADVGRLQVVEDAVERYLSHLLAAVDDHLSLAGMTVVFDGAHGAGYQAGPRLLERLGARVVAIGVAPDGLNINDGVGATRPEAAAQRLLEVGADVAVALDGDGDRLILVDETGEVVDGDAIMAIGARALRRRGRLTHDCVVATVMSNLGLERCLHEWGIELVRTAVGDRHVSAEMRRRGAALGGEQSGHLIWADHATTGDGLLSAVVILAEMVGTERPLSVLRAPYRRFPQALVNVRVREKPPLDSLEAVAAVIASVESDLGDRGRVLVRYSGTEAKARVMVEAESEAETTRWSRAIADALEGAIGLAEPEV